MKTKKYKKLGIEVTETLHYGKSFEEVMKLRPKGWRLLTGEEAYKIWVKEKFTDWFFVEIEGFDVAWLGASSGGAVLGGDGGPRGADSGLGVRWCRKVRK